MRLRTRVLLLTTAFALALFAISFGLSSREMKRAGLAIAWIVAMCSFAAVQITLRKVVRPLEDLFRAATAARSVRPARRSSEPERWPRAPGAFASASSRFLGRRTARR